MTSLKSQLETYGYAVVDALPPATCDSYRRDLLDWVSDKPIPPHGVLSHYQIGHQPFAWRLRTEPAIVRIFQGLYGTDDLVASFDGLGYIPPDMKRRDTDWFHVDQEPLRPGFACYQGMIALTTNRERCFRCIPHSHLHFASHFDAHPSTKPRQAFQKIDLNFYKAKGLVPTTVPLDQGQMLIWDSRVAHCNRYGKRGETRAVGYVSYLPRRGGTTKDFIKRRKAFNDRRTTSHWAYPVRLNSLQPQTYGDATKLINYDSLPPIDFPAELLSEINKFL
jgi:hypothetical protein